MDFEKVAEVTCWAAAVLGLAFLVAAWLCGAEALLLPLP